MLDSIEQFLSFLDKIQGISAAALVACSCIVTGYIMRSIKRFPNEAIPVVVILWGGMAMLLLADPRASSLPARIWTTRNLLVGLTIGFISWLIHRLVLGRIEWWLLSKFPGSKSVDTETKEENTPKP